MLKNFKSKVKILKSSGPFPRVNHSLLTLPEVFCAWRRTRTHTCMWMHAPLKVVDIAEVILYTLS